MPRRRSSGAAGKPVLRDEHRLAILAALERGALSFHGMCAVTVPVVEFKGESNIMRLRPRTRGEVRRALASVQGRGLVYSLLVQRPRPAARRAKRPVRVYALTDSGRELLERQRPAPKLEVLVPPPPGSIVKIDDGERTTWVPRDAAT